MENPRKPLASLDLPVDLEAFLAVGKQLEYDPEACEAGAITILPFAALKLERFPVETGSLPEYKQDPHYPDVKSYLVLGVNLVASCTGGYGEPEGLLLWLPIGSGDTASGTVLTAGFGCLGRRSLGIILSRTRLRTSTPGGLALTPTPR